MKKQLTKIFLFVGVALVSLWLGSWLQLQAYGYNSHAHLSDVGDAITLGEHFASVEELTSEQILAAKATRAVIFRILNASEPGPNAKARLEALEAKLIKKTSKKLTQVDR